jgi:hypothetical protein
MSLEKLLKQKEELESQIKQAEIAEKNKGKLERIVIKLLQKHSDLFYCDVATVENNLDNAMAAIAGNLSNH